MHYAWGVAPRHLTSQKHALANIVEYETDSSRDG